MNTGRQTDRTTDRQIDRQTDKHTVRHRHTSGQLGNYVATGTW